MRKEYIHIYKSNVLTNDLKKNANKRILLISIINENWHVLSALRLEIQILSILFIILKNFEFVAHKKNSTNKL